MPRWIRELGADAGAMRAIILLVVLVGLGTGGAFVWGVNYATSDVRSATITNAADFTDHEAEHEASEAVRVASGKAVLDLLYLIEERQFWQIKAEQAEYDSEDWRHAMRKLDDLSARIPRTGPS